MAHTDQTQLHIGDRVQDRQTGQTGRVIDLQFLADGALLTTVALFVHGVMTGKVQERVRAGQAAGWRWQKIAPRTLGATQTVEITTPLKGTVSESAKIAARQDLPPGSARLTSEQRAAQLAVRHELAALPEREQRLEYLRKEQRNLASSSQERHVALDAAILREEARIGLPSRSLLDFRLQGLTDPKGLRIPFERGSPEETVDTLFNQSRFLRAEQSRLVDQRDRVNQLLGYVTRRRPNTEGIFAGSFISDVIHAEGDMPLHVLERLQHVEALLGGIPIDRTFVQNHPQFLKGEIKTAFDLLQHARATTLLEPGRRRQYSLWREYGALLTEAVHGSRPYQRLQQRADLYGAAAQRRTAFAHTHFYNDPVVADRFNPVLDSSDMGLLGRTAHQQYVLNQEQFEGQIKGELDVPGIAKELSQQRRAAFNRGAGVQLRGYRTGNNVPGVNLPDLFDLEKNRDLRGGLFRLNGQTVRYTGTEAIPGRVTQSEAYLPGAGMTLPRQDRFGRPIPPRLIPGTAATTKRGTRAMFRPVTNNRTLYASNVWDDPQDLVGLVGSLKGRVKQVTAMDARVAQMSRAIANTKSVMLKGGLRGETTELVDVPIHLLQGYMSGKLPGGDRELLELAGGQVGLSRLGFATTTELRSAATRYGEAFGKKLFGSIPEASSALIRRMEGGDLANTVWAGAFLHLRTLPQGLSLGQVEQKIGQRFANPQQLHGLFNLLGTKAPEIAQSASQLNTPEAIARRGGRNLGTDDLLGVLNARPLVPRTEQLSTANVVSRQELKHLLLEFHGQVETAAKGQLEGVFKSFDTPHAQRQLVRARARVNRSRLFRELFDREVDLTGKQGIGAIADLDEVAETAHYLGSQLFAKKRTGALLKADLQEFAQIAGLELMGGSAELNEAFAAYKRNPTAETKRVYETVKQELYLQRYESQYVRRIRKLAAEHASTEAHPLTQTLGDYTHAVTAADRAGFAAKINPLIELAEAGNTQVLIRSGHDVLLEPGGKIGIKLYGGADRTNPYIYRRVGGVGSPLGEARNPLNPADVIGFGGDDRILVSQAELALAQESGRFKPLWHEGHPLVKRRARALTRQAAHAELVREHQYVVRTDVELPFYHAADGTVIGAYDQARVKSEQLIANTRELVENPAAFLSLDIETDIRTGRITNIAAGKYRAQAGKLFSQGEGMDIATPGLWREASMGQASAEAERGAQAGKIARLRAGVREGSLTGADRAIMKNGRRTTIGEVVGSERTLIRRAAQYLETHPEKIVGHNIGFDVGSLSQRAIALGMESEAQTFAAAERRLVDTMILSQAADPTAASHALEWLSQKHLGIRTSQAHLAGPDQRQAAALYAKLAAEPGAADRLSGLTRQTAKRGMYLWDQENQYGYRLAGFLDAETTKAAIRKETGANVDVNWGLALHPVRFTDGGLNLNLKIEGAGPAHSFASNFVSKYETVTEEVMTERMDRAARDLAARRARRILADPNSFGELLKEKTRLEFHQRLDPALVAELEKATPGWNQLSDRAMTSELVIREAAETVPAVKARLSAVHRWLGLLDDTAQGDRLTAQMAHVRPFFETEIAQHQPVIDWLTAHVNQSELESVKAAETQASTIWNEYIQRTQTLNDFASMEATPIPIGRQRLGLELPVLGRAVSVRTGAPEMARRDLDRATMHVAKKLDGEGRLGGLFKSFSGAEVNEFKHRLRADRMLLDNELGQRVREHIFQEHLGPAMRQGFAQRDLAGEQFAVHAATPDAAIDQIMSQGAQVVQRRLEGARDYLKGRAFAPEQLQALQQEVMGGQSVTQVAAGMEAIRRQQAGQLPELFLSARHGVPHEWVGREISDVLLQGQQLKGEERSGFHSQLSQLQGNTRGLERSLLNQKLVQGGFNALEIAGKGPNLWEEALPHAFQFTPTLKNAQRTFKPGTANNLGLDFVDDMANQVGRLKSGRNIALALLGGAVVMAAVSRPKGPAPHGPQGDDAGLASTKGEIHDRAERQKKQSETTLHSQPMTHKIRVSISGEDPEGINHTELVQSVHQALGTYVRQELSHTPDVRDRRAQIDRDYLDRLGAHLLTRQK